MTRIDFYHNAADRISIACRLARKAFQAQQRLMVYCRDSVRLNTFDRQLWAFEPLSFVPHVRANAPEAAQTLIVLSSESDPLPAYNSLLLNLDDDCPPHFSRYDRTLEIVSSDDDDRVRARQRWKHYQDRGYPLTSYDLAKSMGT